MAKINTLNYQTVASWNGSQDLFVVEQPDGTKVATPALVKQFIEAGDFEATGEVKDGHGNILDDVADKIGDLSQTGLTGDSVAAQLGVLKENVDTKSSLSVYQPSNESVTVTGPYADIAFTKPVEAGYTFYLIGAVAINTAGWNMSNINPVAGSIRIFASNTSAVTNLVKTTWLKIKNS